MERISPLEPELYAAAQVQIGMSLADSDKPAEALEAYEFVIYAWRNADPELLPLVEEARRAVTRLSGAEGRPRRGGDRNRPSTGMANA